MRKSSVGTRRQTTFSVFRTESPLASLALASHFLYGLPPPISFGALEVGGVTSWFLRMPTRFSASNEIVGPTEDAPYWTLSRCAEPHLGDKTSAAKLLLRRFTSIFQLWPLSPHSHTHTNTNTNTDTHQPRAYAPPHAGLRVLFFFFSHEGTCRGPGITQNALLCIVQPFLSGHRRREAGEVNGLVGRGGGG